MKKTTLTYDGWKEACEECGTIITGPTPSVLNMRMRRHVGSKKCVEKINSPQNKNRSHPRDKSSGLITGAEQKPVDTNSPQTKPDNDGGSMVGMRDQDSSTSSLGGITKEQDKTADTKPKKKGFFGIIKKGGKK